MKTVKTISMKDLKAFKSQTRTIATFYNIRPLALYLSVVAADVDMSAFTEIINIIYHSLEPIPSSLLKCVTFRNTPLHDALYFYAVVYNPSFRTYTLYRYKK